MPITLDDERISVIPFWQGEILGQEPLYDEIECIESGSMRDWEYCLDITYGILQPALFLYKDEILPSRLKAILCASQLLNFDVFIDELDLYREKIEYNENQFIPVLQKYWGPTACFRPLLFYKDPDRSQETEVITQGQIIAEIVDQCEIAQEGEAFSNIFITAPTGSGKSILFQIPANRPFHRLQRQHYCFLWQIRQFLSVSAGCGRFPGNQSRGAALLLRRSRVRSP